MQAVYITHVNSYYSHKTSHSFSWHYECWRVTTQAVSYNQSRPKLTADKRYRSMGHNLMFSHFTPLPRAPACVSHWHLFPPSTSPPCSPFAQARSPQRGHHGALAVNGTPARSPSPRAADKRHPSTTPPTSTMSRKTSPSPNRKALHRPCSTLRVSKRMT